MQNLDKVLHDNLKAAIDVDFSVLNGLEVLDECVDVGFDSRDLFVGEVQQRSKSVEKSVKGRLQVSQETVKWSWCLVS